MAKYDAIGKILSKVLVKLKGKDTSDKLDELSLSGMSKEELVQRLDQLYHPKANPKHGPITDLLGGLFLGYMALYMVGYVCDKILKALFSFVKYCTKNSFYHSICDKIYLFLKYVYFIFCGLVTLVIIFESIQKMV